MVLTHHSLPPPPPLPSTLIPPASYLVLNHSSTALSPSSSSPPPNTDLQGMDNLGFGNFYPYIPNEVKHRKRTSSAQLKVLETMFKTDTKPNATLRKKLAQELDMTPRGVQVWFQNRRAKEKNKANRAAEVVAKRPSTSSETAPTAQSNPPATDSPKDTPTPEASVADEQVPPSVTKHVSPPPVPALSSPSPSNTSDSARSTRSDLLAARRGSLPANLYLQPHSDYATEYARRCSVDTSLQMLARNPYAPLAQLRSAHHLGQPFASHHVPQLAFRRTHYQRGMEMGHSSMDGHMSYYPDSGDSSNASTSSSPQPSFTSALPEPAFYAPNRMVPHSIPGPLPSPDYSFGAASSCAPHSADRDSPDAPLGQTPYMIMPDDLDDDVSSSCISRFGSITSISTNDSGVYYSECGDDVYQQSRRGSTTTSGINDLMSGMNFHTSPVPLLHEEVSTADVQSQNGSGSDKTSTYPSPAPTVSPPSASPLVPEVDSGLRYPSVDLSYMAQPSVPQHTESATVQLHHGDEVGSYPFGSDHGVYTHHSNSSSSLELYTPEYQHDLPDGAQISGTGHFLYPSPYMTSGNPSFLGNPDVQAYAGYPGAVDSYPKYS